MADDLSKLSDSELLAGHRKTIGDPSQMTDADLSAAYKKVKASERGPMERAQGLYQAVDVGMAEAAAGTMGLPHTISRWLSSLQDKYSQGIAETYGKKPQELGPSIMERWPSPENIQKQIQKDYYGGAPPYEPQDEYEKIAKTGGEFLLGAGLPGGLMARTARVAIPTATTEVGERLTKDTPLAPYGRLGGAVIGGAMQGGAEALFSRPRTAEEILARQLPQSTTRQHIDAAEELMQQSRTQGQNVPLTWPEALSLVQQRPVLSDTMRHLEASSASGPRMAEFYADRPQRVAAAVEQQAQRIAPGPPTDPRQLGPQVQETAEGIYNAERQAINRASDPYYHAAGLQRVSDTEMGYLRNLPGWNRAAAAVRNDPQLSRNLRNVNDEQNLEFVNEVKKQMRLEGEAAVAPMQASGAPPSPQRQAGWRADEAAVRDVAIRASMAATQASNPSMPVAPYPYALALEQRGREQVLEPLMRGPIGDLMKAKPEIKSAVDVLFPKDPQYIHGEAAVGDAVRRIGQVSPKLAEDVVRGHLELAFNKAGADLQSGPSQASGAKLNVLMGGNEQQRRNLQAAMEALPNGAERYAGFRRFMDVMEATGTRLNVGSRTAYNVEALKEFGASDTLKDIAKVAANPVRGASPFIERYNQWKLGKNLDDLAGIMTDPRSANLFREIATSPRGGAREANLVRALIYSQQGARAIEAGTKPKD